MKVLVALEIIIFLVVISVSIENIFDVFLLQCTWYLVCKFDRWFLDGELLLGGGGGGEAFQAGRAGSGMFGAVGAEGLEYAGPGQNIL